MHRSKILALILAAGALLGGLMIETAEASVSAKVYDVTQFTQSTINDIGMPTFNSRPPLTPIEFTSGNGDHQLQAVWVDTRTISASASENLDLAGSLTDAFGATLTFGTVKIIEVKAAATNTNNVVIGGAASNGFLGPFGDVTDTASIRPGGVALFVAPVTGWTVTASTGDILKVANSGSGSTVTYTIKILGT